MESTRHTITVPVPVAHEVSNLTKAQTAFLDHQSTLELYKVCTAESSDLRLSSRSSQT